jgi:hypothetical protein
MFQIYSIILKQSAVFSLFECNFNDLHALNKLENVESFKYLGGKLTTDGREILLRDGIPNRQ